MTPKGQRGPMAVRSIVTALVLASVSSNLICSILVFHIFASTKLVLGALLRPKCVCGWGSSRNQLEEFRALSQVGRVLAAPPHEPHARSRPSALIFGPSGLRIPM